MAALLDIVNFTNTYLEINAFDDYCPNGLQVEGKKEVKTILTGVTASQALLNGAVDKGVDLVMVHHGFFWRGESPVITGQKRKKIATLLENNISLLAYHLPLDAHKIVGNNVQLAQKLGLRVNDFFGDAKLPLVIACDFKDGIKADIFVERLQSILDRPPLHIGASKNKMIKTVGICTGGAQNYFKDVIDYGLDVYVTGEASEQNYHMAMESGVDFISAGHHATERYGVQALSRLISEKFSVESRYMKLIIRFKIIILEVLKKFRKKIVLSMEQNRLFLVNSTIENHIDCYLTRR